MNREAHIYVCGDIQMAIGVAKTLRSVFAVTNGTTDQDEDCFDDVDYLDLMKQEGRYHEDIYSILI